jgi:alpha-ketoglutarate-dependent taurine dioxygenase
MEVVSIHSHLGAEVTGVSLKDGLDSHDALAFRQLFHAYKLLLIRDQHGLTAEEQARFIGNIGIQSPTASGEIEDLVSNDSSNITGVEPLLFHSDGSYSATPTAGISLYAIEISNGVSPTMFASTTYPLEQLDGELRARVERLRTRQIVRVSSDRKYGRVREADLPGDASAGYKRADHPVVIGPPLSAHSALFVSQSQTSHLLGIPADESEAILEQLWKAMYAPTNIYTHDWRVGDLIIWNNLAIQHSRPRRVDDKVRVLRRMALGSIHGVASSID